MEDKRVEVKWFDARIYPGMHGKEDALKRKMDVFSSLGYLIKKDDQATIIAHEITDSAEFRDVLLIPSGSVISIQELVTSPAM